MDEENHLSGGTDLGGNTRTTLAPNIQEVSFELVQEGWIRHHRTVYMGELLLDQMRLPHRSHGKI